MQWLRPDMERINKSMMNDPRSDDLKVKLRYQEEIKALFIKHKVNPFRAFLWPLAQLPVFIAFFMALRDMGR